MILLKNTTKLQIFTAESFKKNNLFRHAYFYLLSIFFRHDMMSILWEVFTTIKSENRLQDLIRLSNQVSDLSRIYCWTKSLNYGGENYVLITH